MVEKYIEQLRPEVLELFGEEASGHDVTHLERTMNIALQIQKQEGGDEIVVGIAAFLHDVHRIIEQEQGRFVSPKDSLGRVRKMLSVTNLAEDQISQILHCIEYHEVYNWHNLKNNENDINTLILQDADNLDAIGAIGIGRTFTYGGAHGVPMYDSSIPIEMQEDYIEGNRDDDSTIHHFYHKLFRLGENMNTKTAKELAEGRTIVMKNFVNEFLEEWNGEK